MCENRSSDTLVIICKVLVIVLFVYPLLYYTIFNRSSNEVVVNKTEAIINETEEVIQPNRVNRIVIVQPSCPISELLLVLQDLCYELFLQHHQCTPDDVHNLEKHKLPKIPAKNNTTEPRGTIVGAVAAGLLLTSLGAAFVELYKAKSHTPAKTTKPVMSRKCSLADLTVLKHNRKELVRRESILEIPENGGPLKQLGRKVSRPPLRLD